MMNDNYGDKVQGRVRVMVIYEVVDDNANNGGDGGRKC